MCPVQTVTHVSGRSFKEISWMREGRPQGAYLVFERGVHMVSTAPDPDTTYCLWLAGVEAPACKPIRANQVARTALRQSGDLIGTPPAQQRPRCAEKCS